MNYTKGEWRTYKWQNQWRIEGLNLENIAFGIPLEANAHLTAAAPDMYEALRQIRDEGTRCLDMAQQDTPVRTIYNIDLVDRIARQALAKAEGKEGD